MNMVTMASCQLIPVPFPVITHGPIFVDGYLCIYVYLCIYIDGLVPDCSNSIANALELHSLALRPRYVRLTHNNDNSCAVLVNMTKQYYDIMISAAYLFLC